MREVESIINRLSNRLLDCVALDNRLPVLPIVLAIMLVAITDDTMAAKCEDSYYYVSFDHDKYYPKRRVRAIQLSVNGAYIYDFPFLPSSWGYDITNYEGSYGVVSIMTAAAKSDKHTIKLKDFKRFVIIRQPKDKSEDPIFIGMNIIYTKKEGGISTESAVLDKINTPDFTLEKINKCLPKKPRSH